MKYSKSCLILLSSLISLPTLAADFTQINITANIVASPCTVSTTTLTIPLGDIQASTLAVAGATSPWSTVQAIQLTNCPATTTGVKATFTGTPATNGDANGYKNDGTDADISVQLADDATTPNYLSNNKSTAYATVVNSAVSFKVKARLYTNGIANPGAVSATVNAAFEYK